MQRVRWSRIAVIAFVLLLSTIYLLPSIPSFFGSMYGYLSRELQGPQGVSKPVITTNGFEFHLDAAAQKSAETLNKAYRRLTTTLRERSTDLGLENVTLNGSTSPLDDVRNVQTKLVMTYTDPQGRTGEAIFSEMRLFGKLPLALRGWLFPESRIQLGLDLKGGVYLALELDTDAAKKQLVTEGQQNIKRDLRERYRVNCREIRLDGSDLVAVIRPNDDWGKEGDTRKTDTEEYLKSLENFSMTALNSGQPNAEGNVEYRLSPKAGADSQTDQALTQVLQVLRNRVDAFGVAEPDIRREPNKPRIIVQLPGAQNSSVAANIVRTMGRLEFRMVKQKDGAAWLGKETPPTPDQIPTDGELLFDRQGSWMVVERKSVVTGADISRAVTQRQYAEVGVSVRFNASGRRAFGEATQKHVNELMAIILDNQVVSFPRINEPILGGEAFISGSFDQESASDLARILRAGAFPVGVKIAEERTVGPSLGREAIHRGTLATLVGIAVVMLFMGYFYNACGIFATVALVLNAVILLGALTILGATLTLPGLAGLILTLGMAVDANVLVNERIKEELRAGKGISASINAGYGRAFWAIFDSNLTTILTAIVLIQFGTGSVRGFGITLTIGIIASMFTALYVTREMFRLFEGKGTKSLPIYALFGLRKE